MRKDVPRHHQAHQEQHVYQHVSLPHVLTFHHPGFISRHFAHSSGVISPLRLLQVKQAHTRYVPPLLAGKTWSLVALTVLEDVVPSNWRRQ